MYKSKITIVGAGQAGLLLGLCLLKNNYDVTIITNSTADEIYNGRILSNQAMFHSALEIERKYNLNFWDEVCPENYSMTMSIASSDCRQPMLNWSGVLKKFYQSVDQRLKFSYWLQEFERLSGKIQIQKVTLSKLDKLAATSDLTIVATGKNELSQIFPRNERLSEFNEPQRILSCLYVKDMLAIPGIDGVRVTIVPDVGEYLVMSGLTKDGSCKMMQFEGILGKAFANWDAASSPNDYLAHAVELLNKYIPWEAELCGQVRLTDDRATLFGSFTPEIRRPFAMLPCGKPVLGLGDAVVLNDPLGGQGSNNATKAAEIYYQCIIKHNSKDYTESWMSETFETYWNDCAKWSTAWTNILLKPPTPHLVEYLFTASRNSSLANKLAEGFNNPKTLFPWIEDAELTRAIIKDAVIKELLSLEY